MASDAQKAGKLLFMSRLGRSLQGVGRSLRLPRVGLWKRRDWSTLERNGGKPGLARKNGGLAETPICASMAPLQRPEEGCFNPLCNDRPPDLTERLERKPGRSLSLHRRCAACRQRADAARRDPKLLEIPETRTVVCRVEAAVLEGLGGRSRAKEPVTEKKQTEEKRQKDGAPPRKRDVALVARLRDGDQRAFLELFHQWHPSMIRVALNYVRGRSVAEEVAQETWLHFMQQLGRFRGRSSLKTWTFRILVNRAINRGKREHRAVSLVRDARPSRATSGHATPGTRGGNGPLARSAWASGGEAPRNPEQHLIGAETRARLEEAIRGLPEKQQLVLTLRDIQGWRSADVCELLDISPENQRVILHRARVQVRTELAGYLKRG